MKKTVLSNRILKAIAILIIVAMIFRPVAVMAAEKTETKAGISTSYETAAIEDDGVALAPTTFIDESSGRDYYWVFLLFLLIAGIATEELIRIHCQKISDESENK